jgi:Rad3-related DNA helicase
MQANVTALLCHFLSVYILQLLEHQPWTIKCIRNLVASKFGKWACWTQIKVAQVLWEGKGVVGVAATGAGKTLLFWIPLLMVLEEGQDKQIIVITPLNLLDKQNKQLLQRVGITAIAVNKDLLKKDHNVWKVSNWLGSFNKQDLPEFLHRVLRRANTGLLQSAQSYSTMDHVRTC